MPIVEWMVLRAMVMVKEGSEEHIVFEGTEISTAHGRQVSVGSAETVLNLLEIFSGEHGDGMNGVILLGQPSSQPSERSGNWTVLLDGFIFWVFSREVPPCVL